MALLEPKLAILDETDSGLDIDALESRGRWRQSPARAGQRADRAITHYQRLLDYIVPDFVHVLAGGQVVQVRRPRIGAGARRARLWLDRRIEAAQGAQA